MLPSSNSGRHVISDRLLSIMRQCYFSYSSKDQRVSILCLQLEQFGGNHLDSSSFWRNRPHLERLAKTVIEIFDKAASKFNADIQPHYKFNPRDLSRMLNSLTYYCYEANSKSDFLDIVANELLHIFADRLVDRRSRFEFQSIVGSSFQYDWNHACNFKADNIYKVISLGSSRKLSKILSEKFKDIVMKEVLVYEREIQKLDFTMSNELFSLIASIERVLIQPGGCLLLAKRSGIPMLQLVQFVGSYLKIKIFSPYVYKSFSQKSFYTDIKLALISAGASNDMSLLVIEDQHLCDDIVLESVNSILCSCEISDIFSNEELDNILGMIKDDYSSSGYLGTAYEYFLMRVKKNLHISVILDVASENFVLRCQSNPALYSQCEMIWKEDWNSDTERMIVNDILTLINVNNDTKAELNDKIVLIHNIQKEKNVAPQCLKEFSLNYVHMYRNIETNILKRKSYLEGGVVKLRSSSDYVDQLSESAQVQRREVINKQNQADIALKEITESMIRAADQKKELESLTEQLATEEEKLLIKKQKIEGELSDVEPLLRAAKSAVGEIRSESLSEIRSLRAPPTAVRDVLEGVLRLMGILDVSWNSMKVFLGQRTVKEEIMNFNARNITKAIR